MDTIVLVGIIINAALLVITAGAAVATIVQARVAVAARADAESARDDAQRIAAEATEAFKRQAAALEKSNDLKEAESRPPVWSSPKHISDLMYSVTNTSGRTLKVDRFEAEPDDAARLVQVDGPKDGLYNYGDSFDFVVLKVWGPRAKKLTVFWRYADEPGDDLKRWMIGL